MIGAALGSFDEVKKELKIIASSRNQLSYQVEKVIGDFSQYIVNINDSKYVNNIGTVVLKTGRPQFTTNLEDYMSPPVPKQLIPAVSAILNIKSIAVYPVISRGQTIGVLAYFLKNKDINQIEDNEKQLFSTYANQIGIALENANLYETSQEVQKNLETALGQLEEVRRHERDMIDIMGHELRTPISIARNALLMMDMSAKKDNTQSVANLSKYLEMAIDSTRREVDLIETLLSATKTEGKGFQLTLEKVNLLDVVKESLEGFQKDAEKKGLSVIYNPPTEPIFIYADKTRVEEAADNFVSNAVKYTFKGTIEIILSKDDQMGYLSVKDTGIGITDEDMKRLGEKFFRARQYIEEQIAAHQDLKSQIEIVRPGGTGLGLFVTFNLIKIMDGKVDVKSNVGEGSTFTLGLPLYNGQPIQQIEKKIEKEG